VTSKGTIAWYLVQITTSYARKQLVNDDYRQWSCVSFVSQKWRQIQGRSNVMLFNFTATLIMAPIEIIIFSLKTKSTINCSGKLVFNCQTLLRSGNDSILYKKHMRWPKVAWPKCRRLRYNNPWKRQTSHTLYGNQWHLCCFFKCSIWNS
jgi:hypothetical protein